MAAKASDTQRTKFVLDEKDIPSKWYNIQADLKTPAPPVLHPGTGQPIGPQDLAPLFPMELIKQEVSRERWIAIPDGIRDVLRLWRPSPLYRARRLERALGTPARIYYKYEGVSPAGSHKPNTAVAQVYYNKQEKVTRISTETGAGQWGSALAMACSFFGLQCKVYMVKVSYQQKPYRRIMMETWGAQVVASPSPDTQAGKKVLQQDPNSPGSLGIVKKVSATTIHVGNNLTYLIDVTNTGGQDVHTCTSSAVPLGKFWKSCRKTPVRSRPLVDEFCRAARSELPGEDWLPPESQEFRDNKVVTGRVRKVICSYPRSGDYSAFLKAYRAKSLELELVPQGTISERMRCHAAGLGGFFSPVSAGTKLAEGKETREIDGRLHVFEQPLKGDIALIKAHKADRWGNLTYIKSGRNFNPVMAMAADLTVAEVDQMVELGEMDPEAVITPSIFVDRVVVVGAQA